MLDSHVHGSLLHDVFVLKVLEHARVFFLRRLGGFIKTSTPELEAAGKDEFEEIAVLGEFFRSRYPYAFLFMNKRHGAVPAVPAPMPGAIEGGNDRSEASPIPKDRRWNILGSQLRE